MPVMDSSVDFSKPIRPPLYGRKKKANSSEKVNETQGNGRNESNVYILLVAIVEKKM